jgi:hypothetical protein
VSTTTFQATCSALIDRGRTSYTRCTRPATWAERRGPDKFDPVCNVHAGAIRRRSYSRPEDLTAITDDMLVEWERIATESKARDKEYQAKKAAEAEKNHVLYVGRKLAEDKLKWSWRREDDTKTRWVLKDGPQEYSVPRWIVQQGNDSWTKIEVSVTRQTEDVPFTVKLYASSEITAQAALRLSEVLLLAAQEAAKQNALAGF